MIDNFERKSMYFGVDYYPEHWPEENWQEDAKLMKEMNINIVRIAEFAWSKLEPEENVYDFTWLDKVIETLYRQGIECIIGTPTAAPPIWMTEKYPDILLVNSEGYRYSPGSRRQYCPNNQKFINFTRKIVTELVNHYKENPAVVAWQIDNEIGTPPSRCYCDICRNQFQDWLKNKYESIENLNNSWGTAVWSQDYQDWNEIFVPRKTMVLHNPGLVLDYSRFCSDSYVEFQNIQVDIIRNLSSRQLITHNLVNGEVDNYSLGTKLDFVSWDNFALHNNIENVHQVAFSHDFFRNIKKDKNHWQMEEQTGSVYGVKGDIPEGKLTSYYWQSIARGADSMIVWRWKQGRIGCEWFFPGILNSDGSETRWTKEIRSFGKKFRQLSSDIAGTKIIAQVALLYSYDSKWVLDQTKYQWHHGYVDLEGLYEQHLIDYFYKPLYQMNIPVDICSVENDFSKYKVIVAPSLFVLNKKISEKLCKYVKSGGNLILTTDTGVKDENNIRYEIPMAGHLRELIGATINDYNTWISPSDGYSIKVVNRDLKQEEFPIIDKAETIIPETAEIFAVYNSGSKKNSASVIKNKYGKGEVIYFGTIPSVEFIKFLYSNTFMQWGIKNISINPPPNVEMTIREKEGERFYFLINHNQIPIEVDIKEKNIDLLSDKQIEGKIKMDPYQVIILHTTEV